MGRANEDASHNADILKVVTLPVRDGIWRKSSYTPKMTTLPGVRSILHGRSMLRFCIIEAPKALTPLHFAAHSYRNAAGAQVPTQTVKTLRVGATPKSRALYRGQNRVYWGYIG